MFGGLVLRVSSRIPASACGEHLLASFLQPSRPLDRLLTHILDTGWSLHILSEAVIAEATHANETP